MNSASTTRTIVRFGAFEVDLQAGLVRKHGIRLRVQHQPLKVLAALVERPGELVTREELRQMLWPGDTFVDFEQGLNAAVTRLRQALGDSADTPRFIETHARLGYRFIAPVQKDNGHNETEPTLQVERVPEQTLPLKVVVQPRRSLRAWLLVIVAVLCVGLALTLRPPRSQPQTLLEQVTRDLGLSTEPAVSADGKLLAYASDRNQEGHLNIWVQQLVPGGKSIPLTHFERDAHQPAFSPDGSRIVFRAEQDGGGLYVIPSIGGEPVRISAFGRDPRFSPDGKWIAFWSAIDGSFNADPVGAVFVMSAAGGQAKQIGPDHTGYPIWCPDSQRLLVAKARPEREEDWWVVPLDGGLPIRTGAFSKLRGDGFTAELGSFPRPAAWLGDAVVFTARQGDSENVWSIRLSPKRWHAEDPVQRLTSGTAKEVAPSVTSDGRIVFAGLTERIAIWSSPMNANAAKLTGKLEKLTQSTASEITHSATPDGRYLAYTSSAAKKRDIHLKDLQTGKEVVLAESSAPKWHPQISRDGSRVAYTDRGTAGGIYVMPAHGGIAERVSESRGYSWGWSSDNGRLLFSKSKLTPNEIWSVQFPSKTAGLFLRRDEGGLYQLKYSPDDRWLAMVVVRSDGAGLFVVPLRDGVPLEGQAGIPIVDEKAWADKPRWSPDGATLYFVSHRDGFRCIWSQRLHPLTKRPIGEPVSVQHFHNARHSMSNVPLGVLELEIAKDRMLFNLGEVTGNIWSTRLSSAPVH